MASSDTQIQVLGDTAASLRALRELLVDAEQIWFSYAWMHSRGGQAEHWRLLPLDRVERGVVGLDFARTEPSVLKTLRARSPAVFRVFRDCAGTFHPKLIVARHGDLAHAIVGSSNFTQAAFGRNVELNLELRGPLRIGPIAELITLIEQHFDQASEIDDELLETYRETRANRPRAPVLTRPYRRRAAPAEPGALDVAWTDYYEMLQERDRASAPVFSRLVGDNSYESELRKARHVFASERGVEFACMNRKHRQILIGLGESWGWFGRMKSSGKFHGAVVGKPNKRLTTISRALEQVPHSGPVDLRALLEPSASVMEIDGVALGCWSRLLCAKRPDVFLSVNGPVRGGIKQVFGRAPTTFEQYVALLETIHAFPWARADKPAGDKHEVELWRGRVAMLDALFYEPS